MVTPVAAISTMLWWAGSRPVVSMSMAAARMAVMGNPFGVVVARRSRWLLEIASGGRQSIAIEGDVGFLSSLRASHGVRE